MVFVHELFCCSPPLRCPRGALGGTRRASATGTLPRWHPLLDTFTAKSSPRARRVLAQPNPPVCSCRSVRAVCWLGLSENTARLARDGCRGEFLAQKGSRTLTRSRTRSGPSEQPALPETQPPRQHRCPRSSAAPSRATGPAARRSRRSRPYKRWSGHAKSEGSRWRPAKTGRSARS